MKALLWLVLAVAIVANALVSLTVPDGIQQVAMSVGTGGVGIAALVGLVTLHRRERREQH
ncbi:hypothetical protein [Plantactinospora sonchi]|uniref:Uncharacterized protein n=1 Tax=Plantactinospora sonchi TaxID=1544735 RepID=A0ABU7RRR8_9ACTN